MKKFINLFLVTFLFLIISGISFAEGDGRCSIDDDVAEQCSIPNTDNMNISNMPHGTMNHSNMHQAIETTNAVATNQKEFTKKLYVPPLLKGEFVNNVREFKLEAQKGKWEFLDGKPTETFGYNEPLLGPVLKFNKNEKTNITILNNLGEETTLHWHGAEIPGHVDGVLHSIIKDKNEKTVEFTLNQPAATLWFHPHTMGKTASQVYKGLGGIIYLEDEISTKLQIPSTYGIDDFPIVAQEKVLDKNGQLDYKLNMMESFHGKLGGLLIINGINSPVVNFPKGIVRLRLLNASNATVYTYDFGDKVFSQIASDGGFLNKPLSMERITLGSGERAEILLDTRKTKSPIYLNINGTKAMKITINGLAEYQSMPKTLVYVPEISKETLDNVKVKREFEISSNMMRMKNLINGKSFEMGKNAFTSNVNENEIWTITNKSGMMNMAHPMHIHGVQFRIIERSGGEVPLNERGYKDTVLIQQGESVKLLVNFKNKGKYMFHCHILEHEESGMMNQFEVK